MLRNLMNTSKRNVKKYHVQSSAMIRVFADWLGMSNKCFHHAFVIYHVKLPFCNLIFYVAFSRPIESWGSYAIITYLFDYPQTFSSKNLKIFWLILSLDFRCISYIQCRYFRYAMHCIPVEYYIRIYYIVFFLFSWPHLASKFLTCTQLTLLTGTICVFASMVLIPWLLFSTTLSGSRLFSSSDVWLWVVCNADNMLRPILTNSMKIMNNIRP